MAPLALSIRPIETGPRWLAIFGAPRSARQVFDIQVKMVQTSCGYAVPFMEYTAEQNTMQRWIDDKSDAEIETYWSERNSVTIDGKPTGIEAGNLGQNI
jgi:hypothetical protein